MNRYFLFILLISFIFPRRDCLQEAEKDALGRSTRPAKETFAISNSGHFYIHYDTTGNAAPDLTDSNGNGIPDYVDEVGMIADSAHHVLVDVLGYLEEPSDGEGGYDIYLTYYSSPYVYGYNTPDKYCTISGITTENNCITAGGDWIPASYLEIDNDYSPQSNNSNFNLTPLQIMRISLGHEYFHGIQWGYEDNLGSNAYFYEMTSMWFEDVLIPDGNDYLDGWADDLLNNPSADFYNTGSGYELALFGHYLSSFLDPKSTETAKNSTIIREMWERYGSTSSNAFNSVKYVLNYGYNISFIEAWADFISRNLYNGIDESFYYYSDQALVDPIYTNPQNLSDTESLTMQLDDESVAIKSFFLNDLDTIFINHASSEYTGRVATLSSGYIVSDLLWGTNNTSLIANDKIHFIYGSENGGAVTIKLFDAYPYNYSLEDINPNSDTYEKTLSPGYFDNKVTLHYFGHQN